MDKAKIQAAIDGMSDEEKALRAAMAKRYYALCDIRDEVNANVAPVQAQLDTACLVTERAKEAENALAAQIEVIWGDTWLDLKRKICSIARALEFIPPRT